MALKNNGWGIILGWLFWIIVVFVLLELIVLKYDNNPNQSKYFDEDRDN
jgi:hypothetical protein